MRATSLMNISFSRVSCHRCIIKFKRRSRASFSMSSVVPFTLRSKQNSYMRTITDGRCLSSSIMIFDIQTADKLSALLCDSSCVAVSLSASPPFVLFVLEISRQVRSNTAYGLFASCAWEAMAISGYSLVNDSSRTFRGVGGVANGLFVSLPESRGLFLLLSRLGSFKLAVTVAITTCAVERLLLPNTAVFACAPDSSGC